MLNNILLSTALRHRADRHALSAGAGGDRRRRKISVGAPYFNVTFGPLMVPLLLALPFGPLLAWKRGDLMRRAQRLTLAAIVALAASLCWRWRCCRRGPWLAPFGIALGVWVMAGAIAELAFRIKLGSGRWPRACGGLSTCRARRSARCSAHFGVGMMVVGIVATSAWQSEQVLVMQPGERVEIARLRR